MNKDCKGTSKTPPSVKPKKALKKALLIGINYRGTSSQLNGCINDVKKVKEYLINKAEFPKSNILTLTDHIGSRKNPTKNNILTGIRWLVSNLPTNKPVELFFQFSGHGSHTYDISGDEEDGRDETIVPLDYNKNGVILDDDLKTHLVDSLPDNVELFCLMDCCHSGTGLDLRYRIRNYERLDKHTFDTRKLVETPIPELLNRQSGGHKSIQPLSENLIDLDFEDAEEPKFENIQLEYKALEEEVVEEEIQQYVWEQNTKVSKSAAKVVCLSGCKDEQYSADAYIKGKYQGAMTWGFIETLQKHNFAPISYKRLIREIQKLLRSNRYEQIPQLSSGRYLNIKDDYFL